MQQMKRLKQVAAFFGGNPIAVIAHPKTKFPFVPTPAQFDVGRFFPMFERVDQEMADAVGYRPQIASQARVGPPELVVRDRRSKYAGQQRLAPFFRSHNFHALGRRGGSPKHDRPSARARGIGGLNRPCWRTIRETFWRFPHISQDSRGIGSAGLLVSRTARQ
jgi:hypothetical protein